MAGLRQKGQAEENRSREQQKRSYILEGSFPSAFPRRDVESEQHVRDAAAQQIDVSRAVHQPYVIAEQAHRWNMPEHYLPAGGERKQDQDAPDEMNAPHQ